MATQPTAPVKATPAPAPNPPAKTAPLAKSTAPVLCGVHNCSKVETDPIHDVSKPNSHPFHKPESAFRHLFRVVFRVGSNDESANVVASSAAEAVAHLGISGNQAVGVSTIATRVEVATVDDARPALAPILPIVSVHPYTGVERRRPTTQKYTGVERRGVPR